MTTPNDLAIAKAGLLTPKGAKPAAWDLANICHRTFWPSLHPKQEQRAPQPSKHQLDKMLWSTKASLERQDLRTTLQIQPRKTPRRVDTAIRLM